MSELFNSRLNAGRSLATAITPTSLGFTLNAGFTDVRPGTYRLRIDSEVLTGDYPGSGITWSNLVRGLDGTTAASHRAGRLLHHVITGESLSAFVDPLVAATVLMAHEEFEPIVGGSTLGLAHVPDVVLTVSRNGLVQSVHAGHYSVTGATLTFSTVFVGSEQLVVAYSHQPDQTLLGSGPIGAHSFPEFTRRTRRSNDYSFAHIHQNTV